MSVPPQNRQGMVSAYISAAADIAGVSPDQLQASDLEVMAFAIREGDPDPNGVKVANDLDSLANLEPEDIKFLKTVTPAPEGDLTT